MNKIRCLVIDDEPLAVSVLEKYIAQLDTLTLCGRFFNALDALAYLHQHKVDLIFLDIRMPKLTGLDFLKTLPHPPKVIFTTAFREYAIDAFDLNVLDYLLKPIPFERFLTAVNKYHAIRDTAASLPAIVMPAAAEPFIYLKADKKMVKVNYADILYIESMKDYVKVKTTERDIITYQRITYLEEKLPDAHFLRIHRSFIIAISRIRSFNSAAVEIGNEELPIGRQFKADVMRVLGVAE